MLDLAQGENGKIRYGNLTLQWIVHTQRTSYRLINLKAAVSRSQVVLTSSQAVGWDSTVSHDFSARIFLEIKGSELSSQIDAYHPDQIRVAKTVIQGLPPGSLRTITGEGAYYIGARHRVYEYPSQWATPFVWLQPESSTDQRFVARCVANPVSRKAFSARLRPDGDSELILYEEIYAPNLGRELRGSCWKLRWAHSLLDEFDAHGRELGKLRELRKCEERDDMPSALKNCSLVVKLHGMDFGGMVHMDFEGMANAIRALARYGSLRDSVFYLVGWDGPFMRDYPSLTPSSKLGGTAGLSKVVETAHSLGAKIILYVNPVVFSEDRAESLGLDDCQAIGLHRGKVAYPEHDWDNDGFVEGGWILVNPWYSDCRQLLVKTCARLLRDYNLDGFFLADMGRYVADPRGDFYAGWKALTTELKNISPEIMLLGEGKTDFVPALVAVFDPHCRADMPEFQLTIGRWGRSIAYSALADAQNRAGVGQLIHAQHRPLKGVNRNIIPAITISRETLETQVGYVTSAFEWSRQWEALYGAQAQAV